MKTNPASTLHSAFFAFVLALLSTSASAQSTARPATPPAVAPGAIATGNRTTTAASDATPRLTNLSVRARAGSDSQIFTIGFTLAGTPDKPCLLRVIGPSLAQFGVANVLADPSLILIAGTVVQRANDNWALDIANGSSLVAENTNAFNLTGAFPLDVTSKDAAFIKSMTARAYTAQVANATTPGTALFELYDLFPDSGARLSNLSARAQVGPGADALIAGFVITGTASKQVLIRGIGPGLTSLGLTGTLTNPKLDLYRGATVIQSNDDWAGTSELTAAFTATGAFALPSVTSRDAALLVTLAPGAYTAVVSSAANETGLALVEIYEIP